MDGQMEVWMASVAKQWWDTVDNDFYCHVNRKATGKYLLFLVIP